MKQESKDNSIKGSPSHLGLILDGNRRWAREQGLPTLEGHKKGYDNMRVIAEAAFNAGVKYVSAYIFSTENWNRSKDEVGYLMKLVVNMASEDLDTLISKNIKVVFLGTNRDMLDGSVKKAIEKVENKSASNTGGTLALCFNYGGQLEIVDAVKSIVASGVDEDKVDEALIADSIYHPEIPPLDFVIRTSGEQRFSNFMLWRIAYSEFYFTDKHWPEFSEEDLDVALIEYANRQRRFGK